MRKIARAVSYDMPRTLIAGTVKPCVSPRPRAMYRSWIDAARTPTAWPSSQISQRACSFSSPSPKTAARTSVSIARRGQRRVARHGDASVADGDVGAEQRVQGFDLVHVAMVDRV